MQIKTMRYYLISVRKAVIKREKREKKTLVCLCNHCRKQYEGCSKNEKNRTEIWASNYTSGYLLEENKNTLLKIYMYLCVHYSTIYSSQDMEATSFC